MNLLYDRRLCKPCFGSANPALGLICFKLKQLKLKPGSTLSSASCVPIFRIIMATYVQDVCCVFSWNNGAIIKLIVQKC